MTRWPDAARLLGRACPRLATPSPTPFSCSIRAAPACSSSPSTCGRPQGTNSALPGLHHRRAIDPAAQGPRASAFRAPRNGSTICRTRPTRNSSPTTSTSTNRKAVVLRRADLRCGVTCSTSAVKAVNGDLSKKEEMRKAMQKAEFQIRARQFQVRQQPHPDPEFLSAGRDEGGEGDYVLKTVATIVKNNQDRLPRQVAR